ncbi:MAG: undecaprenyldiphospho-muramoylpentapeptide beta-N-acetylglucosaminyltransferase [Acidobacteria bacterium]|nr:undecaprenyldiphospho-muramoylpentapeptide beta-N-acetylglucosaminyltransferase [Acidobacteriota bacterium]
MTEPVHFVMAGGHTGGHITPALAVARVLREHGHQPVFIGTQRGLESKLVPGAGFPIEWIEVGGVKGAGLAKRFNSLKQLPVAIRLSLAYLNRYRPRAIFSMGGFVAAPVVVAAILKRVPLVVMEPNAMPGAANRYVGRFVARALLSFPQAQSYFPQGRSELSGMPVRAEFFALPPRPAGDRLNLLITGGSQGARSLNLAAEDSWRYFERARIPIRIVHQTGPSQHAEISRAFKKTGLDGEVVPFISDMPAAFGAADLIVSRSGAGTVSEIAAAGKPSILVPYPFAADQHQLKNAQALVNAGAARMVLDAELSGERLFSEVRRLWELPGDLAKLAETVRQFAKPNAAARAAEILEAYA